VPRASCFFAVRALLLRRDDVGPDDDADVDVEMDRGA
jgi:hypothetical protein